MTTLKVGIADYEEMKARTLRIARGEERAGGDEPKVWFTSSESFAKVLSADNRKLLRVIAEQAPGSLEELSRITGRATSNLSRTLKTMASYGLVRMEHGEGRRLTPKVVHDRVVLELPLTEPSGPHRLPGAIKRATAAQPTTAESVAQAEYEVPLTDGELLDLGRVTAILSQIDVLLTEALSSASRTPAWAAYIFSEKATMSAKIGMLKQILDGLTDEKAKKFGEKLVKSLHRVNDDRNMLFHGMWAYHLDPKTEKGKPACIWQKKKPIRPSDLPEVAARAASVSRHLGEFLSVVNPLLNDSPWSAPRRLFISTENVDLGTFRGGTLKRASI